LFETQADARPDAVAVDCGGERTTYAALDARANQLARRLHALGVGRGALVGLHLARSTDAYTALLGTLKAGGAYVPIDPECPAERARYVLENSGAAALVTTAELAARSAPFHGAVVCVDTERERIAAESALRLPREAVAVSPRDPCYVIYTSGSTGRPKGVLVEHRNAWHLVRAEGRLFALHPEDRVYQGFSLAFDASVEEMWLAFHAGATLVAATPEMASAGPDLSRLLAEHGVTVLSCVPTLLTLLAGDVPTLRLLILGGESCSEAVVAPWLKPGRRVVNTYGPTETTVIATYADVVPGQSVTIGRPLPGYRVYLLDEAAQPVSQGTVGEICIGGPGVARGYLKLPAETRRRFVPDPFEPLNEAGDPEARLYRSGDLGRLDDHGNIEFRGRLDAQVKIRGFRVELEEIEALLVAADDVRAAACTVRQDGAGIQHLVAYVVPRDGARVEPERLRSQLRGRLPPYMVPALIEPVADLPRLPSGKLDRAQLPTPATPAIPPASPTGRPRTETERRIAAVWQALFHPQPVSVDDHFFLDLGGHSLLAARMVSELRKDPRFAPVSVLDVYQHPTIASLAQALDSAPATQGPTVVSHEERGEGGGGERRRHFLAGLLQSVGLYFVFGFRALQWVTPYLVYFLLQAAGAPVFDAVAWAAGSAVAVFPVLLGVAVSAKWVLLGRIRPGRHPLWGWYYLRWWFVHNLVSALPLDYLAGTPLLPLVYRWLGARIGKDVHIGTDHLAAFDVVSIGDGTCVDDGASLLGYVVEDGELVIGRVRVGRGCLVGTWAALRDGTRMEDGARLEDLSLLLRGARIGRGETWAGSPARRVSRSEAMAPAHSAPPPPVRGPVRRAATAALYAGLVLLFPLLLLGAIAPGMLLLTRLLAHPLLYLAAAPLVGGSFGLCMAVLVAALKWLLIGRIRPGTYPVHGWFYVRKWIVDQLLALGLDFLASLRATLYLAPWYRALGAKLGRFVELSTATSITPDLLEIEEGGTVADEASLGAARVEGGWMTLARTRLGRRAFVGNSAVVPAGAVVGDGSLVGVLSLAPTGPAEAGRRDATWLGSPPRMLPRREPSAAFSDARTFRPSRRLWLARGAFELLRVTLPPAGFILVTATVITAALGLWDRVGLAATLGLLPLVYAACCAGALVVVALAKWTLVGRFRPFVRPLWSGFVWRLELSNALYEFLATPLALDALQGTPFLPWYFRLLGARIGRRVYSHTTGLIEFDLVDVGDRTALNEDCVLQTHLFEDRVLKASHLRVGADCTVGAGSVVLYDARMEDGARLDAISLLMKGETLPAGTAWAGSPAVCRSEPHAEPSEAAA